jgi:hypothetical protein
MRTKTKTQLKVRLDTDMKDQLTAMAYQKGYTVNDLVNQAVKEFLDPEDFKVVALRYLADTKKNQTRQLKRLELIEETLGQFVYLYFFYTPEMPHDATGRRSVSIASARSRFERFLGLVSKKMEEGNTYRDAFETALVEDTDFSL